MTTNWRSPNIVGMIYEVETLHSSHEDNRTKSGDILLCARLTGDCYYNWIRLKEVIGNEYYRYFKIDCIYQSYAIKGKELIRKALSSEKIIDALLSPYNHGTAVVIPRPTDEIKKLLSQCPTCGQTRKDIELPEEFL